jgi:uncharacterized protein YggT (Ycf19 family)
MAVEPYCDRVIEIENWRGKTFNSLGGIRFMTLIDFILNIVGLLLWLNWRAAELPVTAKPGTSLLSTLRSVKPPRPSYYYLTGVPILLAVRALFYWQAGPRVHWSPRIPLGPTLLSFRSDLAVRMFLFSLLSFGVTLGIFYCWLLLLSCVNRQVPNADPVQRLVRLWLGRLERLPTAIKLLLPLAVSVLCWYLLHPLLVRLNMVPGNTPGRVLAQGAIIGLASYFSIKFVVVALLVLYLFNSYVYLGEFALWSFVTATAGQFLRLLRRVPLRAGKIDFAPVTGIVLVLLATEFAQRGLNWLYQKLP